VQFAFDHGSLSPGAKMHPMWLELATSMGLAGTGLVAWSVRGRSSRVFGPSVWRGLRLGQYLALTFDDGPSESTSELLDVLDRYRARATFFQCGFHVRRLPSVAREVVKAGHEVGNHTDTHPALYFRSAAFIEEQVERAQSSIAAETGSSPVLFRPPYGVRWFGLRHALHFHGLTAVMWSTIGRDWTLPVTSIVERLHRGTAPGAILCLHDGRVLQRKPDIRPTLDAVVRLLPVWCDQGYEFVTVSDMIRASAARGA
jgi:peptidoglycan/xylan/chitin deacetylase (PgdA/CDA1 family)